jgi:general secretion pathway protein D
MGGVLDGTIFSATLEAVATLDNVSIISRPKIAVREGGRADISNTQRLPILDIGGLTNTGGFTAKVSYQEVGTRLFVVPRVVGTDTVALTIDVEASQQTGSEPILATTTGSSSQLVTVPVLSLRTARTTVYLQPGQAVILGGLINERNVDSERKVPILGDIPLLNVFFKSKFTRKEQTNVLFFIRPRILQGSDLNREF